MITRLRCLYTVIAVTLFLLSSCTTKSTLRIEQLSSYTVNNEFLEAAETIKKKPELYGKTNAFLYHMDLGVLYHYAGMYDSSNVYLQKASEVLYDLFARSVTNEVAAMVTNDNIRPYRSKPYEIVILHQFLASNFLAQGDIESALVESRRLQLHFDEWNRKNTKDGEKYDSDGMFHYLSSIAYDGADETSDAMISLYHAIKAFKEGPVPLPESIKNKAYYQFIENDRENDNALLKIAPSVDKDKIEGLENHSSEIIFIGYAGRGPMLTEKVWWGTWVKDGLLVVHHKDENGKTQTVSMNAPALPPSELKKAEKGKKTKSGTTFHIKFSLPAVKSLSSETSHFSIKCNNSDKSYTSVVINDLDKQAQKQLEDTKTSTMMRTIIRVVLRTIAAEKAKSKMQTNSVAANLLLNIGTDILADQLEKADTRSCFLLPKTVQVARIPVQPGTYKLDVTAKSKSGGMLGRKAFSDISVGQNEKKFVFYSSFK